VIIFLRSLVFNLGLWLWTCIIGILCLPSLLLPYKLPTMAMLLWIRGVMFWLRVAAGIRVNVTGRDNLPREPAIIAAKHQSAWETFGMMWIVPNGVLIMKQAVLLLPIVGWYLYAAGHLPIDRKANANTLRKMLKLMQRTRSQGRHVLIFPEGTRVPVGSTPHLQVGVLGLARQGKLPIVPVSLNSGLVWPKNSFLKYPGLISVHIHPSLPYDLDKQTLLATLHEKINIDPARMSEAKS
jgi:1-acyl-sn-glycerol-3-phosphate acyltransferase